MNLADNGKRIMELRKQHGLSRAALAREIGVTEAAIQYYETGQRRPRDEVKVKIANFFGVSLLDIFYADSPTNS